MKFIILLCLVSCASANHRVKRIVGGEKAAIPQALNLEDVNLPDDSESDGPSLIDETESTNFSADGLDYVVVVNEEFRKSKVTGVKERNGQVSFRGIRYAEPPVKRGRFARPVLKYMNGEIDATKYGSPCLQRQYSSTVGDEDCLFLNVYTPSVKATGLPVFFWIHGGGFKSGSGNQYAAAALVAKNVIVVTINYRLGTLGFLGTNDQVISGNSGLFDIRAGFEWTKRYIKYFGGDPKKIFPAGQGSGASVATLFAQSSFTSDGVKGVIAMSGSGLSSSAVNYSPNNTFESVATMSQCSEYQDSLKVVRCLQDLDVNAILETDSTIQQNSLNEGGFVSALTDLLGSGPVIEGKNDDRFLSFFLNDNPLNALQAKQYPNVPLLIGTTKQETGKLISGPFYDEVINKANDPNFLKKSLPQALLNNNKGLFTNGSVNELLKNLFENGDYLNLISSTVVNVANIFIKVIEETTDALFNLPAATTSLLWNKVGGPVYFYSFEHAASLKTPITFLDNPLYAQPAGGKEKVASHGDDLIFLFELQSLEGQPIAGSELTDPKDKKVKEIFVNLIAEFLLKGKPKITELKTDWPQFANENSYVIISPQPQISKRFRYCELALWGGFVDRFQDPTCKFPGIDNILKSIPNLNDLLKNNLLADQNLNLANIQNALKSVVTTPPLLGGNNGGLLGGPKPGGGGGLLGGGSKQGGGGLLGGGSKPLVHLRVSALVNG
ncbi:carboxylesterase 5A isoform X2 [Planococcus citri]|uniref:carboxylesterase 5A isoform X2 n=1 Tax=Planococcus citri TaxID=170843 RepID=UPI0031F7B041